MCITKGKKLIDSSILDNNSHDEIIEALNADLGELVQRARRAREVGDSNQVDILHGLIDEDLVMIQAIQILQSDIVLD